MPGNNFTCYVASQKSDIVWTLLSVYNFVSSLKLSAPGWFRHCPLCDISL